MALRGALNLSTSVLCVDMFVENGAVLDPVHGVIAAKGGGKGWQCVCGSGEVRGKKQKNRGTAVSFQIPSVSVVPFTGEIDWLRQRFFSIFNF